MDDLIQLQIRKVFYDMNKSMKALAFADTHYNFLTLLQYLKDSEVLTGTKTNQVPYEVWSHIVHGSCPGPRIINIKLDFEKKLYDAMKNPPQK